MAFSLILRIALFRLEVQILFLQALKLAFQKAFIQSCSMSQEYSIPLQLLFQHVLYNAVGMNQVLRFEELTLRPVATCT